MIQPYSYRYLPPIPVLDVFLSLLDTYDWPGPFPAVVDSGADLTIVPLPLLLELEAPVIEQITLSSQWHDKYLMYLFQVDFRIADAVLPVVDVAGDPNSEEVILGRNVLNRLDLRLEGPRLRTHILEG